MLHTLKHTKQIFLVVLPTKLYVLMINLASQLFFTEEIMLAINYYDYYKQIIKSHFNKNLAMSEED